ncbi:MAG: NUDIX hydrolase [Proteobacteria bacterium]|nr:NUDIX hydrolase [Pseudomonadota bacterium]
MRPRDAASLVLLRRTGGRIEVLMGQRHPGHAFMPNRFVFPGGSVDRSDRYVRPATPLRPEVAEALERGATSARARALAIAAVRETFEETGLRVGAPAEAPARVPATWRGFLDRGLAPALGALGYFCRAITPPAHPIRFDARFFLADAEAASGELKSNGELQYLQWLTLEEALALPLARITHDVLEEAVRALAVPPGARRRIAFFRTLRGVRSRGEQ